MNLNKEQLRDVINAHERTELQTVDHDAFFSALEQPAPATAALSAAFKRLLMQ